MAIPHAPIVGLGIGQAEFSLVKKQKRWLQGLETTGFDRLAAVIRAFPMRVKLSRKYARLVAATARDRFPA